MKIPNLFILLTNTLKLNFEVKQNEILFPKQSFGVNTNRVPSTLGFLIILLVFAGCQLNSGQNNFNFPEKKEEVKSYNTNTSLFAVNIAIPNNPNVSASPSVTVSPSPSASPENSPSPSETSSPSPTSSN